MRRADHVVLINPPSPWLIRDTDMPPLGIMYLAANLRVHGVSVEIVDLAERDERDYWVPRRDRGTLYGIGFTTPHYPIVKKIIEKFSLQHQHLVLGGPHCSAVPIRTLREFGPRALFMGEADWSLVDYVMGRELHHIPGLVWRNDRGDNYNVLPQVDVDLLPMPARDLIDIDSYNAVDTYAYVGGKREGHIITGRGCPYNCAFCAQRTVTGGRWRERPVEDVLDEVKLLKYRYGCDQILFPDDTFNVRESRVYTLAEELGELGVTWHCLCRADRMSHSLAQAMYAGGCRNVIFGFETGSDTMLCAMGKRTTVEQNFEAARICHEAGIAVRAQMIVGFPGETERTIAETAKFVYTSKVDKWGFHAFVPLPGSDVWNHPGKYGLELDQDTVDFSTGFTTIGRPGEWPGHPGQTQEWIAMLTGIAKGKNAYDGLDGTKAVEEE